MSLSTHHFLRILKITLITTFLIWLFVFFTWSNKYLSFYKPLEFLFPSIVLVIVYLIYQKKSNTILFWFLIMTTSLLLFDTIFKYCEVEKNAPFFIKFIVWIINLFLLFKLLKKETIKTVILAVLFIFLNWLSFWFYEYSVYFLYDIILYDLLGFPINS